MLRAHQYGLTDHTTIPRDRWEASLSALHRTRHESRQGYMGKIPAQSAQQSHCAGWAYWDGWAAVIHRGRRNYSGFGIKYAGQQSP